MARPRTPAKILELRGAFKQNPQRRRQDSEGGAPFEKDPPSHLPQGAVAAWHYIVARLPKITIYNSDEVAVEIAAKLLAQYWLAGDLDTVKELRQWLDKLGMTPRARTNIPPAPEREQGNRFADT